MSDQRRHPRVLVALQINWGRAEDCAYQARITSLSINGCFVQTEDEVTVGETLYVRLSLPEKHLLHGTVRYNMPGVGFGLVFQDLTVEDQFTLEALVAKYLKQE